ncbi:phosphoribosylglycinamide formyltransferase [Candidatus Oleimmundimicrobium sp.]|uniref:phosphoribosylglycinamide formyltransferase n=1 Tax=Candidatus Oleimmundimicrobium sp. TaxID=3060597 RepID=UPI0027270344|nr:phosphoribosylglycinamide formyltransferase [Candidatus Oleimmundimicrobium sp.]MDO8885615.1 phosphoribosylglycinamide formyltransferase [Candidatus Oleimmundimicrobium sp.]
MSKRIRLGILASGSGTNLQAIIDACESGDILADVVVVISNVSDAYALERARKHNIKTVFIDKKNFKSRQDYDKELVFILKENQVDLVVLAGYMLLVGPEFVRAFRGRIMNIHPALLPSFPGTHSVKDALDYGVKVSGVTVHFVDEGLDTGPIILQEAVPVMENDTVETLHNRIHQAEYKIYPASIKLFAEGRLKIEGRKVRILEKGENRWRR